MEIAELGFTGTQKGMTKKQKLVVTQLLNKYLPIAVHHGDCVGADADFHSIIKRYWPNMVVVLHPPTNTKKRAFCEGDVVSPAKEYLVRNREIVDRSEIMIAAPETSEEERRSGTWATIRYAKEQKKIVFIVNPDGEVIRTKLKR